MQRGVDVSIIVPCYNTERFLGQALASAQQNSRAKVEILVLNDGSTDGSPSIMRAFEQRDQRIRVIDKPNQGYGATVNRGIDEARGTYVAVLEPDDWVLPGMHDDLFGLARATAWPDVVKSSYWRILSHDGCDAQKAHGYLYGRIKNTHVPITLADEPQLIQYHPSVWSALYRRSYLNDQGIRMREVPGAGWVDNPFCVHTMAAARSIVYTNEPYYCYREDLASASSAHTDAQIMIDRWNERQDVLDQLAICDAGILKANYVVGLRFMAQILRGELDHKTHDALVGMARRMDQDIVRTIDCIPTHVVARCMEFAGSNERPPSALAYKAHLAREASWALRSNGPKFLFHNLKLALSKGAHA